MPSTDESKPSRRALLKSTASAAASGGIMGISAVEPEAPFANLLRPPDVVRAFGSEEQEIPLSSPREGLWTGSGVEIQASVSTEHLGLSLQSQGNVSRIHLRWHADLRAVKLYLGDHWERSYGDLEWRGEVPGRVMPWYFMATDGRVTHGYGVRTGPHAMCFWTADSEGISLWADVRSGGLPVALGDRTLQVAEIVCRRGRSHENPFRATQAFCTQMCASPRLPKAPVYGTNDWNYAYGNNSAELIAGVSGIIAELSPNADNRPFSVIDDGWSEEAPAGTNGHGSWMGNPRFGDMAAFSARLKGLGVRPGLWFRPLIPLADSPDSWRSGRSPRALDPTIPEVQEHVASHLRRFTQWGYEMIKHDYSTFDLFGEWGFQMGPSPTRDGWRLHDNTKTNAEVLSDLYRQIRDAAGSAYLVGCNTVGHLTAGTHEIQRIGDDTSGRSWNRNRRMGVNALAFRAAQHDAFFAADPDIVAITHNVPWKLVWQWLRLVSGSGAALFVAVEPSVMGEEHRVALRKAFETAAVAQPIGEPLDWLQSDCPRRWKLLGRPVDFAWMGVDGAWPFAD